MSARPKSAAWRLADRQLDGRLAERLTELRSDGVSFDEISRTLFAEGGVEVAANTLRAWVRVLELAAAGEAV